MITRYVLVNEAEKSSFEKEWQLPYGYQGCLITTNLDEARQWLDMVPYAGLPGDWKDWFVEEIDEYGNREIFYQK